MDIVVVEVLAGIFRLSMKPALFFVIRRNHNFSHLCQAIRTESLQVQQMIHHHSHYSSCHEHTKGSSSHFDCISNMFGWWKNNIFWWLRCPFSCPSADHIKKLHNHYRISFCVCVCVWSACSHINEEYSYSVW